MTDANLLRKIGRQTCRTCDVLLRFRNYSEFGDWHILKQSCALQTRWRVDNAVDISVNLKNTAQVFAAAGLSVLLDASSRFDVTEYEGQPKFRASLVLPDFDMEALLAKLRSATYTEVSEAGGAKYSSAKKESKVDNLPVRMQVGEQTFELDWWLNEFWSDKSGLKLWAGTVVPVSLLQRLTEMLPATSSDILNEGVNAPKSNRPSW